MGSPELSVPENAAEPAASAAKVTFEEVLARAVQEEKFFTSLCRVILTRSVLFAVDQPAAEGPAPANADKFSIKILKSEGSEGLGVAMLFSSKAALAASGEKFGWHKNQKGMYSFAAMNGQAAFHVLQANGYKSAVLDAASPNAFTFSAAQMTALAAGQVPLFYDPA